MKIAINDQRKIFAIQEEFSKVFPYLKISFYAKPHNAKGTQSHKLVKEPSTTLGECRTSHNSGEITISPTMTVTELEQRFRDVYGLGIQLFRKSGNMWLETSMTEAWTLEDQNKQGELLKKAIPGK
jgi:hypothetical protein